ncbi:MAG: UDP-glucose 4-epimerase GalE [Alphaproteobacteria bacterium HGW-Alphaproteobacteria-5]|nr:MAG: UDP-glucose 4-epimerase GalE [Alphaproteobacteria bacterium HGW-Alphaproteobacteria-5]
MSVLVTGGAGYIGSHTVIDLLDAGEKIIVLDDLSTGFEWAVHESATLYTGDISDVALVGRLINEHDIETVIHFAGSIVVPESVAEPLKYYLNNTVKTRSLIESCVTGGVGQFIFSSTAAVYGMPAHSPVDENAALNPMSPYGRSKLMSEWMLGDVAAAHGLKFAALRYFNVAGADPKGRVGQSTANATHLLKAACETALGQRPYIEVYGDDYPTPDGTCLRDYIHVADLAAAHTAALHYLRAGGGNLVVNCGYGHGYSVREVLDAVERVAGHRMDIRQAPRRPGDPAAIVADPARIKGILDWQPRFDDLDIIVAHALAWERRLGERNR